MYGDGLEIFSFNPSNYNANSYDAGINGNTGLMPANNGILYYTSYLGGTTNQGAFYGFNTSDNSYTQLYSFLFTGQTEVSNLLVQASNGKLYGVVEYPNLFGSSIYSIDVNGSNFAIVASTTDSDGFYINSFTLGNDGKIYGTVSEGGLHGLGTIFSFDPSSNIFTKLFDFDTTICSSGSLLQANNNIFYSTANAVINNNTDTGFIFSFNAITRTWVKLHSFRTSTGWVPGALMQASDGKIYAVASKGGANKTGVVFRYDISTNTYSDIYDFQTSDTVGFPPMGYALIEDDVSPTTNIQGLGDNQVAIFPNPSSGNFHFKGLQNGYSIEVYNPLGETIYTSKTTRNNFCLTLTGRDNGIYFYRIIDDNTIIQQGKLVLE